MTNLQATAARVRGQMRFYEGRSEFSTITVNLIPEIPPPPPEPAWDPGLTYWAAADVLTGIARETADLLIWMAVLIAPMGLFLVVVLWIVRLSLARLGR